MKLTFFKGLPGVHNLWTTMMTLLFVLIALYCILCYVWAVAKG